MNTAVIGYFELSDEGAQVSSARLIYTVNS